VGYVPVAEPLIGPFDGSVVLLRLLIPLVPVLVELPTPLDAAPVAALLAPPPPASCAKAMDEVTARTEAKAIVRSLMSFPVVVAGEVASKATAPANGGGRAGAVLGGVPLGEPAQG
jgi:hypothetical protein